MNVLRSFVLWLNRLFHKAENCLVLFDGKTGYDELLISHLEAISKGKVMRLRKKSGINSWKGEVGSMTDVYLFLIKLPCVYPDKITFRMTSDRLIYLAYLTDNEQLIIREKYVRGKRVADLKLINTSVRDKKVA